MQSTQQRLLRRSLIVVEDDQLILHIISEMLRLDLPEVEVILAANGREAMALLEHRSVDLIVTDLRMPGVDGVQLLEWVSDRGAVPRVIVVTACATTKDVERLHRSCGSYILMEKPLDLFEFVGTVRSELEAVACQSHEAPSLTSVSETAVL